MNLSTFVRQRVRIERRFAGAKRAKAIFALARDAGALPMFYGKRIIAWRLRCGAVVCVKRRYPNWHSASQDMARIRHSSNEPHLPARVYQCESCNGFHLTSQAVKRTRLE